MASIRTYLIAIALSLFVLTLACGTQVKQDSVESGYVTSTDGVEIAYDSQGEGTPAVVFVHGWSNNRSIWRSQVERFSENYQVVTIDLAGFGESGTDRAQWTMGAFANDVNAVIDTLNLDKVVLVGFSLGTAVVVETANMIPESVRGIVLVDQIHDPDKIYPPPVMAYIDSLFMDIVNNPTMEKLGLFFRNNREESFQRVVSMVEDHPKVGWRESLRSFHEWRNTECRDELSKLTCPVVAINSTLEPTNVDALESYISDFRAEIIPDVGHLVMWDAPQQFDSLLEASIQSFSSN